MLRQVFIYYDNEIVFQYFFAKAFDKEALEIVLKKRLLSYITNPVEGKILNKSLLDFQTHFVYANGVFFLFVTDMADRPKLIAKEVERASKLFLKNFPDPKKIKEISPEKEEFTIFIKETHYYLHPKITMIGPVGSGKSTIVNILNQEDKSHGHKIMDFAFYYKIKMGNIFFDLWDFIARDDFSPLWNNFTRGSDVIFFIIDGSNFNDEKIKFFINLKRREGKYSNWAIILTHADNQNFVSSSALKERHVYLKDVEIFDINLIDQNVLGNLSMIFTKILGLKESLPQEFRKKLIEANNFVAEEKYTEGIELLRELIGICEIYQEFAYLEVFQNKIKELEEKLQLQLDKKKLEKDMFKAPEKVQFKDFRGVNQLPGDKIGVPKIKKLPVSNLDSIKRKNDPTFSKLDQKNPFFSDLITKKDNSIKEMPPGAPIKDFEIKTHKIAPINIDRLNGTSDSSRIEMKEKFLESSLSNYKSGQTREKKLTLERSPLISKGVRAQTKAEIRKIKPVSSKVEKNPLGDFILQPKVEITPISIEAEKLGEEIRNLGESLSITLCRKFVEQLRIRLNKKSLNDDDINKAARFYVSQRRKRDQSS
ncbi:ADP-ribosylation factor-like protein [Promethearchaeum syntrophicum]|uniref:ADP-ribosylation factor-like protein n=1 Tax=Promethearchaeum syntrophicum TaxID=2594042 RepID=A0A5B9DD14_9ARCH|nr:Rab family GTPase [Candidatus Prometheoarchaeum syntrophicum]